MYSWGNWETREPTPEPSYVEWFRTVHRDRSGPKPKFVRQIVPRKVNKFQTLDAGEALLQGSEKPRGENSPYVMRSPEYMTNQKFAKWWRNRADKSAWLPPAEEFDYPTVKEGTVIAGIIDFGLPLSHSRFRNLDGTTRVLGTWLQGAPVRTLANDAPMYQFLPFGTQHLQADIDDTLREFSTNNERTNQLDQDGFNRALDLVNYDLSEADRGLSRRATHGAHVMGLVGGADSQNPLERKFSQKVRFLTVSLPPMFALAEGGTFLDFYLIYALRWLMEMNIRISKKSGLSKPLPLVTNISVGKHAGSKDAFQPFVAELSEQDQSGSEGSQNVDTPIKSVPFHAVLPAGNSNLDQAMANLSLAPGKEQEIDWVIQPSDDTSNFLEIWHEQPASENATTAPLEIELVPPGQPATAVSAGSTDQVKQLQSPTGAAPLGRIYCERAETSDGAGNRFRYLICLAPDRYQSSAWTSPPAGRWRIRLRNATSDSLSVSVMVQTDMAAHPGGAQPRRSYLEDSSYKQLDPNGHAVDSYAYSFRTMAQSIDPIEDTDTAKIVSRHGTLNSYAANISVATIAGYRRNDGRPAVYSCTGPRAVHNPLRRTQPTAALPTDDGYAHLGVLSDGASDGSKVALQGTSFASAAATRLVLEAWLNKEHDPYGSTTLDTFLSMLGQRERAPVEWFICPVHPKKVGSGRIVVAENSQVPRV